MNIFERPLLATGRKTIDRAPYSAAAKYVCVPKKLFHSFINPFKNGWERIKKLSEG
jgi:hypothetical protein